MLLQLLDLAFVQLIEIIVDQFQIFPDQFTFSLDKGVISYPAEVFKLAPQGRPVTLANLHTFFDGFSIAFSEVFRQAPVISVTEFGGFALQWDILIHCFICLCGLQIYKHFPAIKQRLIGISHNKSLCPRYVT
jgi:hypothetical protein